MCTCGVSVNGDVPVISTVTDSVTVREYSQYK